MRPQDWAELAHAIGIIRDYLEAAAKLERDGQLDFGSPVEKVLRECKVHPDTRPMGQAFDTALFCRHPSTCYHTHPRSR
jgi:hypothetical protein